MHRWVRSRIQDGTIALVERYGPARVERVLDLGCGYGDFAERLAARCREVIAVDFSPGLAAETETRLAGCEGARTIVGDVRAWEDYAFDVVHLGAVGMFLEDEEMAGVYARAAAGMNEGGVMVQREWVATGIGRAGWSRRGDYTSVVRRAGQYVRMAEAAGLVVVARAPAMALVIDGGLGGTARAVAAVAELGRTRGSVTFVFRRR